MSADPILGPMGTELDGPAIRALCDADGAATFEQVRWARAACVITRAGWPLKAVDIGHEAVIGGVPYRRMIPVGDAVCEVCGKPWPCQSAVNELDAFFGPGSQFWLHNVPLMMAADGDPGTLCGPGTVRLGLVP